MKTPFSNSRRHYRAFTLIELLVVIAIIAVLAAILLPTIGIAKQKAMAGKAKLEISQIKTAIEQYHSTYSRYPVSKQALDAALGAGGGDDFTFGDFNTGVSAPIVVNYWPTPPPIPYDTNNAEVMAILMDYETYPNGTPTLNRNHVKNTQQIKFLNAKESGSPAAGGIDPAGVYRDPWGFPYIITMDLNYDEKCRDAVYRRRFVSQQPNPPNTNPALGFDGLFNSQANPNTDFFEFNGGVMVWSRGIDRQYDPNVANAASGYANTGVNKDNILSWK